MSWYWNQISNKDSARYSTTTAMYLSYFNALFNGLIATISLVLHKPIAGLGGGNLLAAALFAIVGWQIGRLSRAWAVIGFCLCLVNGLIRIGDKGLTAPSLASVILATVFLAAYLNAVRGTFAYHKYTSLNSAQPSEPTPAG